MPLCFAMVETEHASKYLQQLCKHFAHKIAVDYDAMSGRAELPPGLCLMTASDSALTFFCRSHVDRGLKVMQAIIDDHLLRFAWREEIEIAWQDGIPEGTPEDIRREMEAA